MEDPTIEFRVKNRGIHGIFRHGRGVVKLQGGLVHSGSVYLLQHEENMPNIQSYLRGGSTQKSVFGWELAGLTLLKAAFQQGGRITRGRQEMLAVHPATLGMAESQLQPQSPL